MKSCLLADEFRIYIGTCKHLQLYGRWAHGVTCFMTHETVRASFLAVAKGIKLKRNYNDMIMSVRAYFCELVILN